MTKNSPERKGDGDNRYPITIRTITAFVPLFHSDFQDETDYELASFPKLEAKLTPVIQGLKVLEATYQQAAYTVQTLRLATNPFGEWLVEKTKDDCFVLQKRLIALDQLLSRHGIFACGLGPAKTSQELSCCRQIVRTSDKFSCSVMIPNSNNVTYAEKAAQTIYDISTLQNDGLANFQFCVAAKTCQPWIPFFPIAYHQVDELDQKDSSTVVRFAIGLENGPFVRQLLQDCQSIANIDTIFRHGYTQALLSIQEIAESFDNVKTTKPASRSVIEKIDSDFQEILFENLLPDLCPEMAADLAKSDQTTSNINQKINSIRHSNNNSHNSHPYRFLFVGIDTSVNPSLDLTTGSVASALECLAEVQQFGGPGTMAAAAAITRVLQSVKGIRRTGYCGLMMPVCEDRRLAELSSTTTTTTTTTSSPSPPTLSIVHLLNISSVCGVGVDTVPIPGNTIDGHSDALSNLTSLLLDVVGLAERWNKPLTCRVFPVPGKQQGEMADFDDFPHLVNSGIFSLEY
jgi:uncharacterized protein